MTMPSLSWKLIMPNKEKKSSWNCDQSGKSSHMYTATRIYMKSSHIFCRVLTLERLGHTLFEWLCGWVVQPFNSRTLFAIPFEWGATELLKNCSKDSWLHPVLIVTMLLGWVLKWKEKSFLLYFHCLHHKIGNCHPPLVSLHFISKITMRTMTNNSFETKSSKPLEQWSMSIIPNIFIS